MTMPEEIVTTVGSEIQNSFNNMAGHDGLARCRLGMNPKNSRLKGRRSSHQRTQQLPVSEPAARLGQPHVLVGSKVIFVYLRLAKVTLDLPQLFFGRLRFTCGH